MPKFLIALLLLCSVAFGDEYDARVRTLCAKVVFESKDQAVIPDTPPNVRLSIARGASSAWQMFLNLGQNAVPPKPVEPDPVPALSDVTEAKPVIVASDHLRSSCRIRVDIKDDAYIYGSGTVIKGGVLTAAHLWSRDDYDHEITVECGSEIVIAKIRDISHEKDLCLLECKFDNAVPVEIADSVPENGRSVTTCGRDLQGVLDETSHTVIGLTRQDHAAQIWYRPPPFEGRSGGGMFCGDKLVGVVSACDEEKRGWAISATEINQFLSTLRMRAIAFTGDKVYRSDPQKPWCPNCVALKGKWKSGDSKVFIQWSSDPVPDTLQIYPAIRFYDRDGDLVAPSRDSKKLDYYVPSLEVLAQIIRKNT